MTLERAWSRAFQASELLRTGEWAPRYQGRHAPRVVRVVEDIGRHPGPRSAGTRRAAMGNEELVSNAVSGLRLDAVRDIGDRPTVARNPHGSPSIPEFNPPASWLPTLERVRIEDEYLDEVIEWLQQHGEEATREQARSDEWARREAARVQQRAEFDMLRVAIEAYERDYRRIRPGM